jgi:hypothetical protein
LGKRKEASEVSVFVFVSDVLTTVATVSGVPVPVPASARKTPKFIETKTDNRLSEQQIFRNVIANSLNSIGTLITWTLGLCVDLLDSRTPQKMTSRCAKSKRQLSSTAASSPGNYMLFY